MDFMDETMKFHNNIHKEHELKYQEYERLRAECPKLIKQGQIVLVAVGFLGHGFHWIRKECQVLDVKGDNCKISFPRDNFLDKDEPKDWVYWIPNCLVTAIL